jgi:hypothetical protein
MLEPKSGMKPVPGKMLEPKSGMKPVPSKFGVVESEPKKIPGPTLIIMVFIVSFLLVRESWIYNPGSPFATIIVATRGGQCNPILPNNANFY